MSSVATRALIKELKRIGAEKDLALMMECATDAWQLSNNAFPYGLDLLARNLVVFVKHAPQLFDETPRLALGKGEAFLWGRFNLVPLRIWLRAPGTRWARAGIRPRIEGALCVDPYLNLDLMAASPDARFILEQRAALAECLFIDEMPEDQLREFMDHVRVA